MHTSVLALSLLILTPGMLIAQGTQTNVNNASPGNDRRQVVPFLDATYVAIAHARGEIPSDASTATAPATTTFEADIVPNFVVRQTFFDVMGNEETKTRVRRRTAPEGALKSEFRFAYSIVAVPMVKLRMFIDEQSSPVRTPSYMPKGTGQLFWFKLQEKKVDLFAAQATVGHHSNGQDGCLFKDQQRESEEKDADCVPAVPADRSQVALNRRDGSFSTNYLVFGWRYRHIRLDAGSAETELTDKERVLRAALEAGDWAAVLVAADALRETAGRLSEPALAKHWMTALDSAVTSSGSDDVKREKIMDAAVALVAAANPVLRTSSRDMTLGADLELNPGDGKFLGGAGIDPELKSRYGPTRVTLLAGFANRLPKLCDRAEVKGFGKYIGNAVVDMPSWAWSLEGQCLFKQTNWGLFARYYWGQDYYNLGFEERVSRLQVGMTYSQEGFLRFRARPVSPEEARRAAMRAQEQK
ncbi:hypothetical protein TBR22_A05780 [Luteitalea sp. TBR-22]|uniref:hypothetical protein n=1 Tax=Luteitalea sp. TBR-22 TaxID=2802971 RepID=UPI001AF46BB1|nr:hypothetical protein [Luteitalea sp. TBR-22]BCS31378.1 hypothetical protein TBR22_A05780 [Luteitalea sp. TBR-22]